MRLTNKKWSEECETGKLCFGVEYIWTCEKFTDVLQVET